MVKKKIDSDCGTVGAVSSTGMVFLAAGSHRTVTLSLIAVVSQRQVSINPVIT